MLKRLLDIVFSFSGLVVLLPAFAVIALLIRADSKGPVFFRGVRVGRLGKPFRIYKFRTMVAGAEKTGVFSTAADDPRITRVGRFLRSRFPLDELPQLINILKGEMSFVGPRPEAPRYLPLLGAGERAILGVRPGLTDYASMWNPREGEALRGSSDPDRDYIEKIRPEKVRLQLKYVEDQSFWVDLKIVMRTISIVLKG